MSFQRWGYDFEGAFLNPEQLRTQAGVYVIWCEGETWKVLDVGESEDVRSRVAYHERAVCWREHCTGTLQYSAKYTPWMSADGRLRIEAAIRLAEKPPCGEI